MSSSIEESDGVTYVGGGGGVLGRRDNERNIYESQATRREMRKLQGVGCMSGIFLIARRLAAPTNKNLLTAGAHHNDNMEPKSVTTKAKKQMQEKSVHEASKIYPSSPTSLLLPTQSPHIQDVVKESMHREARTVSLKHIDSPRPPPVEDRHNNLLQPAPRNPPRFSCDGIDSRLRLKATMKLKDVPRLSLDSGLRFIKSSAPSQSRSYFLLGDACEENNNKSILTSTTHQDSGCSHSRSSSVVAKLMGLEAFPEAELLHDTFFPDEYCISMSSRPAHQFFQKDSASVQLRPATSVMKSTSNSSLPLELAPSCQSDCSKASHIKTTKKSKVSSTVFGEIDKRITELEFKKSGKDLRALKQILEAMHKTRPKLECQKQEQLPDFDTHLLTNRNATYDQSPRLPVHRRLQYNHPASTKWESYLTNNFNSSILMPKQGIHNGNTKVASSLVYKREDPVDKGRPKLAPKRNNVKEPSRCVPFVEKKTNGRPSKSVQDHNHMQVRSPGAVSPRLQDKRQGKDRQSNFPPSDSSRVRRHQNKQPKPGPPNRRHKLKSNNLQHDVDQLSETSSGTRNFSEKGNTSSVQSERNNCLVSFMEPEVTSRNHTAARDAKQQGDAKEMNPAEWLGDDTAMTEQPSPVSVLDAALYIEDSPSPVKKISRVFRDYEPSDANEAEWHTEDLDCLLVSTRNLGSEYNHKKLEDIQHLVHKLSILNTDQGDSINQIASLCQSDNFEHQYIKKIVLASGILKGLDCVSTTELHPSDNLINPELFHVLEQTEDSTRASNEGPAEKNLLKFDQKMHRKIIFDTVNEILVHKLDLKGSLMPRRRCLSGQQLLKELYAEIDYLQPKSNSSLVIEDDELVSILTADLKHESEDWAGHQCEIPALVLSIERLIFKDLVTEVIRGDGEERSRGHCRQLFTQ